jgi:hypothetical protein
LYALQYFYTFVKTKLQTITMNKFKSNAGIRLISAIFIFISFVIGSISAQNDTIKSEIPSEITLYAMPTLLPLSWESPATLFESMQNCYLKTMFEPSNYLLGHVAVKLTTPLIGKPLLLAMTASDPLQRIRLVLGEKIGFGILGTALYGKIEPENHLENHLKVYANRKKLAFITFRINEQAARRILAFIDQFTHPKGNNAASSSYYGGTFWPRYENEGAGCSAFGLALLDVAHLRFPETDQWQVNVKIPMKIIGGEFNHHKKIRNSTIRHTKSWYMESGRENIDYVAFKIYDPSIMFDWIMKKRVQNDSLYHAIEVDGVPGLYVDARNVTVNPDESLFIQRPDSNLFILKFNDRYLHK